MEATKRRVGFALKGISVEQFAYSEKDADKQVQLGVAFDFRLNTAERLAGVFIQVNLLHKDSNVLKLVCGCHYEISPESWNTLVNNKKSKVVFPRGFVVHLAMITTGTARGILYAKTEKTPYASFVLPMLDAESLFKKDIVFNNAGVKS